MKLPAEKIITEKSYDKYLPVNRRYNRLLKNYVIRANKQLKNGIEITDELKDEILDYYNKRRINFNDLSKMEVIYKCPSFIARKYIEKFKNEYNIKYTPTIKY